MRWGTVVLYVFETKTSLGGKKDLLTKPMLLLVRTGLIMEVVCEMFSSVVPSCSVFVWIL